MMTRKRERSNPFTGMVAARTELSEGELKTGWATHRFGVRDTWLETTTRRFDRLDSKLDTILMLLLEMREHVVHGGKAQIGETTPLLSEVSSSKEQIGKTSSADLEVAVSGEAPPSRIGIFSGTIREQLLDSVCGRDHELTTPIFVAEKGGEETPIFHHRDQASRRSELLAVSGTISLLAVKNLTDSVFVIGTTEFVAPEIVSGNVHDLAVDGWSRRVVSFDVFSCLTPFRGSYKNHLEKEPRRDEAEHWANIWYLGQQSMARNWANFKKAGGKRQTRLWNSIGPVSKAEAHSNH